MYDYKIFVCLLIQVSILPCQLQTKNTDQLPRWKCRVHHRAKHIEKSFYSEFFADRRYIFHCRMKQRSVHKTNIGAIKAALQFIFIVGEFITEILEDIRRSRQRRNSVVAMFSNGLPRGRYYKRR